MHGNLLIHGMIKYHFDRRLPNKVAQYSKGEGRSGAPRESRLPRPDKSGLAMTRGSREANITLTLPHPNPLHQVERGLPSRERRLPRPTSWGSQ